MRGSRLTALLVIGLSLAACGENGDTDSANASAGNSAASAAAPPASAASNPSASIALTGTPPATATVGEQYSFQPALSSSSAGASFSASGLPPWLSLNSSTGELAGTPAAGNEGTTGHITITANAGGASASTTPFTIKVEAPDSSATGSIKLSWIPPTKNTDGTPVTNLAGYHIYYGTNPSELVLWTNVVGADSTAYVVGDLAHGTYYFSVVAYNAAGLDSGQSNVTNETI
jgi:hypothetical protein